MTTRPRLVDVAARAGVSEKTVSNFVNGYPHISESTKQKVQSAISELGYRPNLSARSMGRGRTGFIAFAVPSLSNPYFAELSGYVIAAAAEHRWTVMIEETGSRSASSDELVESLPYLVDGIILHPESLSAVDLANRSRDTPIVLLVERDRELLADHVFADNVAASDAVTTHLLETGRRRIAVVGLDPDAGLQASQLRFRGFRAALDRLGVRWDDELLIDCDDYDRAAGAAAAAAIAELDPRPDAVLCFNSVVATGLLSGLHSRGIRIPDDIAVAAFDDIAEAEYASPPLTTIAWDVRGIAGSAVRLLAERYDAPDASAREVSVSYELKARASTGRPA